MSSHDCRVRSSLLRETATDDSVVHGRCASRCWSVAVSGRLWQRRRVSMAVQLLLNFVPVPLSALPADSYAIWQHLHSNPTTVMFIRQIGVVVYVY